VTRPRASHAEARGVRVRCMRGRLSYANVVASLALFVALGGTSYAVIKLPRNSVGSREIKNRSVRAGDIALGVVKKPVRGPRGATGAAGDAGATGPRGPSDVVTASRNVVPMALNGPSSVDAVTLNLRAGTWWVVGSASVVFFGPGGDHFRCSLVFGTETGTAPSVTRLGVEPGSSDAAALVVHEGRVLSGPTAVRLRCGHDATLGGGTPRVDHAQLTAIRTESLDIQPG